MNETLSKEMKEDGWKYGMTKCEQVEEYGYVVQDMIDFRHLVCYGNLEKLQDYIETKLHCIDLDYYDATGVTPLQWAAFEGYPKIVQALIEAKADPSLMDKVTQQNA